MQGVHSFPCQVQGSPQESIRSHPGWCRRKSESTGQLHEKIQNALVGVDKPVPGGNADQQVTWRSAYPLLGYFGSRSENRQQERKKEIARSGEAAFAAWKKLTK